MANRGIGTIAIHGRAATTETQQTPSADGFNNAIFPPIVTATTFTQSNLGEGAGFCYSRCGNPTRTAYEAALAALEGGVYATATASGMAATSLVLELLPKDAHVIVMSSVYGGTYRLFETLRRHTSGLSFTYVDLNDLEAVKAAISIPSAASSSGQKEETIAERKRHRDEDEGANDSDDDQPVSPKRVSRDVGNERKNTNDEVNNNKNNSLQKTAMIWIETPTNPLLELVDIAPVCCLAKEHGLLTCVDNTFATAWNQQPLKLGADIVMLSCSKYIGGHSDLIGGALITGRDDLAATLDKLKTTVGAIASPFDAYLALRGLKTLHVRMERQCANALRIAEFLSGHNRIAAVHYPGLPSHPQHTLCTRQMRTGGAVVTIRLKKEVIEGQEANDSAEDSLDAGGGALAVVRRFIQRVKLFVLCESLGGVESMVNHSASMSHGSMDEEQRQAMGIYPETLRLSVGIEDIDDLIEDLRCALVDSEGKTEGENVAEGI